MSSFIRHRTRVILGCLAAMVAVAAGAASGTAGASAAASLGPGDHVLTLTVQGIGRTLLLHVPPGRPVAGRPLVLIYHGSNATAAGTVGVTDFVQESNRTGELVAFLQGVGNRWNEYSGRFGSGGVDDVAYTVAVIHDLESKVAFDHARIVAAGFSNGAFMVESLGCQLAGTLAMVVPVEGQLMKPMVPMCAPSRPISVYEIHGTADALVPYGGGGRLSVLSAPASASTWASLDHCASRPATTTAPGIKLTTYTHCRGGAYVELRTIYGGVHRWTPGIGEIVTAAFPWNRPKD